MASNSPLPAPLLSVRDLHVSFALDEGLIRAVDGVSFDVMPGRVTGIVGESGCGKSVTMRAILQLVDEPGRIEGGEILFDCRSGAAAGKNSWSSFALSKPDIGPQSRPSDRAASMK